MAENPKKRAIIETLYSTGVRLSELINIKLQDINWEARLILIKGKGEKERIVLFNAECEERLKYYLSTRHDTIPYLIISDTGNRMYARLLQKYFEKYTKKLGFKVSPHTLRHTFAAHLAQKGMPLACIQELLGHADIRDTRIYAKLYEHARRNKLD